MTSSTRRRPNALKHGAYSRLVLFPWEDEKEYEKLESELRDEWDPHGAFEEDAVFTILTSNGESIAFATNAISMSLLHWRHRTWRS